METNTGSSNKSSGRKMSELEMLQKQVDEKEKKIEELKRQIECAKVHLEKSESKQISEEKKEQFKKLTVNYNNLRDDYYALLAEKSKEF